MTAIKEIQPGFADNLKYDGNGLVPAIIQEEATGQVLMLAYMNKESLETTLRTGKTCFFSRSRQQLVDKRGDVGELSGCREHLL